MAFCKHGISIAKDLLSKLTDFLDGIINPVLAFTGAIMNNADWPTIVKVLGFIPGGAVVATALQTSINALTEVKAIIDEADPLKKLQLFIDELATFNPLKKHGLLIKLASILTAAIHAAIINDNEPNEVVHTESVYDSLVQIKALNLITEKKAG